MGEEVLKNANVNASWHRMDVNRSTPRLVVGTAGAILLAILLAGLLVAMYRHVGAYFFGRWVAEKEYQHCFLVLPLVGWLIWRQRANLTAEAKSASWLGLPVLAGALAFYLVGLRVGANVIVGVSAPLVLVGIGWSWLGWAAFRHIAGPTLLTAFLVAVPRHLIGLVAMPMQVVSARAAAAVGGVLGVPVEADGVKLTTRSAQFIVAQECSGMNSLLALLLIGCAAVCVLKMRPHAKLLLLVLIPPIVLVANVIRLVTVVVGAEFLGPELALQAMVHGMTDIIVYLVALTALIRIAALLGAPREADGAGGAGA